MFDVGFSELFLIALVALIVLGPERLPKAARFAGLWVRRARAQWYSVKSELERELAAEELQRSLRETRTAVDEFGAGLREAEVEARREFESLREAARRDYTGAEAHIDDDAAESAPADADDTVAADDDTEARDVRP